MPHKWCVCREQIRPVVLGRRVVAFNVGGDSFVAEAHHAISGSFSFFAYVICIPKLREGEP